MFRQDRTNPSSAVSNWKGRRDTAKAWPSTAVSSWLNGGLFGGGAAYGAYWMGARYGSPNTDVIDFTNFANDANETLAAVVGYASGVYGGAGFSNNGTAGYVAGGWNIDDIYKMDYATQTTSSVTDTLDQTYVSAMSGCANSPTNGYVFGGYGPSMWADAKIINKMVFSSEAVAAISAEILGGTAGGGFGSYSNTAVSNNGTAAIVADGAGGNGAMVSVSKLTYSGETMARDVEDLPSGGYLCASLGNGSSNAIFVQGELSGNREDTTDKYVYATDVASALGATTSFHGTARGGGSNSGEFGYIAGGDSIDAGYNPVDTLEKFTYSSDSVAVMSATLGNARNYIPNGVANCESL